MKEPVTTDGRISFWTLSHPKHPSVLMVFDRPGHCAVCKSCLLNKNGECPFGGPFKGYLEIARNEKSREVV